MSVVISLSSPVITACPENISVICCGRYMYVYRCVSAGGMRLPVSMSCSIRLSAARVSAVDISPDWALGLGSIRRSVISLKATRCPVRVP